MTRALFILLLGTLWIATANAGSFSLAGSSTLHARSELLEGDLRLTLNSTQHIYKLSIATIDGNSRTSLYKAQFVAPGQALRIPLHLVRRHPYPGQYQLLLEVRFQDQSNRHLSVNLHFPYTFIELGNALTTPLLLIEGETLNWQRTGSTGQMLALDLSTGPYWKLAADIPARASSFQLSPLPGLSAPPNGRFAQLATLNWLGTDGFHYSRAIPWEIHTDSRGQWRRHSPTHPLAYLLQARSPLFLGWLGLIAGCGLAALFYYRSKRPEKLQTIFAFGALATMTLWLATYTHLELWFTDSWPTGGDLASHILYADTFRDWLFEGKITGWMPEVFAGFPAFRFYFPLPFALIALLSLAVPIQIAIKVVVMAPALLLPATVYWMGGQFRWPLGARLFAALFSVGFLIHTGTAVWGGNLLAQLAGEFSYSWGLLLTLIFWGSLVWAIRTGGRSWAVPAIVLVCVGLSHGYPLLIAGFSALLMPLFYAERGKALAVVLKIHLVAFLLLGFWLLPLIENLPYTIPNDSSVWTKNLATYVPHSLIPLLAGLPFLLYIHILRSKGLAEIRFLLLTASMAFMAFAGAYLVGLADIRFFPFVQLCLAIALGASVGIGLHRWGSHTVLWSFSIAALLLLHFWLGGMGKIEQWSRWNLEGYENKAMWPHYRALATHLSGELSAPRVIFEHAPANNDIGSTRALEALPLFGSRPVLEGLYMEASLSGPFIYQLQAEISQQPSSPLARFPAVKGIAGDIAERLRDFYVDTVVVRSMPSVEYFDQHPDFYRSGQFGPLSVFKSKYTPALIEVEPALAPRPDNEHWLADSFTHYILQDNGAGRPIYGLDKTTALQWPVADGTPKIELLNFSRETLRFKTDSPGKPHLIKITYHPAWKSLGGEQIYKASPAFMLLFPATEEVELVFAASAGQQIGKWFSLAGLILLIWNILPITGLSIGNRRHTWLLVAGAFTLLATLANYFHPNRIYTVGHELFRQGDYASAALIFEAAVDTRQLSAPRAEALFWAARNHDLAGQAEQALTHYQRLLNEHPASYWAPESLYRQASIYAKSADDEKASVASLRLLTQFPNSDWANRWRQHPPE